MFYVYENGKPAILPDSQEPGWKKNYFYTKREAEIYAFHRAYPYSADDATKMAPEMKLGIDYDYSMGEFPVLMRIEEE